MQISLKSSVQRRENKRSSRSGLTFLVADTRLHLAVSVGRSVGPSASDTFLKSKRFLHYCSCPTIRDWIALFSQKWISFNNHPAKRGPSFRPVIYLGQYIVFTYIANNKDNKVIRQNLIYSNFCTCARLCHRMLGS